MTEISTSDKTDHTVDTMPKTALAPGASSEAQGVAFTGSKVCRKCGTVLDDETWSPYYKKKNNRICRKCVAEASKKAYHEDPKTARKKYRDRYADHIGAEGKAERKQIREQKFKDLEVKLGTTEQLAWAAGLWEAEGNIDIEQGKHVLKDGFEHLYPRVRLRLFNNDTELLEKFKVIMGGVGSIRCDKEAEGNRADAFVYYIRDSKAVWIIQKIWPYIVSKYRKNQIREVYGEAVATWATNAYKTREEKLSWMAGIHEGEGCAGGLS